MKGRSDIPFEQFDPIKFAFEAQKRYFLSVFDDESSQFMITIRSAYLPM